MSRVLNVYQLMWGIEKYVVSGAVAGLTAVSWHDEDAAYTDGATIHLPRPNAKWTDEELLLWRYKAEHELGHEDAINSNPHWKEVMVEKKKDKRYKDDGLLWWLSNLLSDHVQEHNRIGDMIGRDEVLLHGRQNFLQNCVFKDVSHKVGKGDWTPDDAMGTGIFLFDTAARMKWNPHITLPEIKDTKTQEIFEMVRDKGGVDPCVLKNEDEVFEAALKIRKLFPDVPPENEFQKVEVKASAKMKTDKAISFMPTGYHADQKRMDIPYGYENKTGVYTPRVPVPLSKNGRGIGARANGSFEANVKSSLLRTNLPSKVRSYLMAMKREKYTTGWRTGRLDTNRLPDVLRGKEDLFRQKEPIHLVDSAVYLLVDSSGSMNGEPFRNACASAVMLAEALQGIGVSVEVAGFTEFSGDKNGLIHDTWLPFGQRFVRDNVIKQMGVMSNCLSNNADGENILFAYNRLKQRKENRKILIVLSDGEPAASGPDGATIAIGSFTKQTCEMIEKDKDVLLVGLGMSGYSPNRFYKNAYRVDYGQPLEPVLLGIVKDAVLRR